MWSLIVLAAVIGFVFTLATWANRQMLDTESWTNSSSSLLQDPQIRGSLSVYIVNEIYDNVDVQGELQVRLPSQAKPFAGPIAAGLREPAQRAVAQLLDRPRVQALWVDANRIAHSRLIALVESKTRPGVSTDNGNVVLDVSTILTSLGQQLGLPTAALEKLPPDAGKITVLGAHQLSPVQTGVRLVRAFSVWLIVLDFVLWGLALYFAVGARRAAVRDIGWSVFAVGATLLVVRHELGSYVVQALTTDATRPAGGRVWILMTGILSDIGWACVAYGLAVVGGASLAGPSAAARAIRSGVAPVLNRRPAIACGIVAFAYVLLVAWGPTHALRVPLGILILGLLIAVGVYILRRQTLTEFPHGVARNQVSIGASARAALMSHRSDGKTRHDSASVVRELTQLGVLRAEGAISAEEFQRAKEKVLA